MAKLRKLIAVILALFITFSWVGITKSYAQTELTEEEQRIISVYGELPPQRPTGKSFIRSIKSLLSSNSSIADGVYYIKNNSTGTYLEFDGVSQSSHGDGATLSPKNTVNPSGNNPNRLTQLWRVTKVGSIYTLRPLHMLNVAFSAHSQNNVITYDYNSTNTGLIPYSKWELDGTAGNCTIIDYCFGQALSAESGSSLNFTENPDASSASWSFEAAANIPSGVIVYYDKAGIKSGEKTVIKASAYSPTLLFGTVNWSASNSSIVALSEITTTSNKETKLVQRNVTGVSAGIASINISSSTNSGIKTSFYFAVNQLADGEYFIRNKGSDLYMDITGPTMSSGANIRQWNGTALDSQIWIVKFNGDDGYYTIKSLYSSLYLTVKNNSASDNASVIQSTGNTSSGQRWKITYTNGAYKIEPKCASGKSLGLASNNTANGTNVVSKTYSSTGSYCDWYLSPAIYGRQIFRELPQAEWIKINATAYAMMNNKTEEFLSPTELTFWQNVKTVPYYAQPLIYVKNRILEGTKSSFEDMFNLTPETNFSENGQNTPLKSNQYRIVLRTGARSNGDGTYLVDYHFWYQTFDGRWANKHGLENHELSKPTLLPEGVTPFSANTSGWEHYYKDNKTGEIKTIQNFYDSQIYSYIITVK